MRKLTLYTISDKMKIKTLGIKKHAADDNQGHNKHCGAKL